MNTMPYTNLLVRWDHTVRIKDTYYWVKSLEHTQQEKVFKAYVNF